MNSDDDFYDRMRDLTPADFDGHTEFHRLTPAQRLAWLSAAVQFFYEHTKELPPRLRPPEQEEIDFWTRE